MADDDANNDGRLLAALFAVTLVTGPAAIV